MSEQLFKKDKDLDKDFRYEVAEKVGAKTLLKCIQCGVCSSGCTVTEYVDMQPHRVVASCLLGLKDEVLSSQSVWTCSLCHRCTERCPKGVDYSFILALLRNLAAEEGRIPDEYSGTVDVISENGFVVPFTGRMKKNINRRRENMGLPKISAPNLDDINYILEKTGLKDMIAQKHEKEGDD
ncbi:MAG: 4Fe-4S dicluster domain-containing protein [Promethearchaeia archaeon]